MKNNSNSLPLQDLWDAKWSSNDIKFHDISPNPELVKHFPHFKLKAGARVLVPLCGKSVDLLWLERQGCEVWGLEFHETPVQAFYKEHDLDPQIQTLGHFKHYQAGKIHILQGNFFDMSTELIGHFDFIYDRAALIAIPTKEQAHYAEIEYSLLAPGGQLLLLSLTYDEGSLQGPPYSVSPQKIKAYFPKSRNQELLETLPITGSHLNKKGGKNLTDWIYAIEKDKS